MIPVQKNTQNTNLPYLNEQYDALDIYALTESLNAVISNILGYATTALLAEKAKAKPDTKEIARLESVLNNTIEIRYDSNSWNNPHVMNYLINKLVKVKSTL